MTAPSADIGPDGSTPALSHQHYVDLVVGVVADRGPVGRSDIAEVLEGQLPADLTDEQKRVKGQNLIQEARKSGRIVNRGSRRRPAWVSSRPSATAGDVHK